MENNTSVNIKSLNKILLIVAIIISLSAGALWLYNSQKDSASQDASVSDNNEVAARSETTRKYDETVSLKFGAEEEYGFIDLDNNLDVLFEGDRNSFMELTLAISFDPVEVEVKNIFEGTLFDNYSVMEVDEELGLILVKASEPSQEVEADDNVFLSIEYTPISTDTNASFTIVEDDLYSSEFSSVTKEDDSQRYSLRGSTIEILTSDQEIVGE